MKNRIWLLLGGMSLLTTAALANDIKGSIKIGFFESEHKAMQKVKVPMVQAIEVAKQNIAGQVIKAKLDEEDDYLVYEIKILKPNGGEKKVLIDPVTAKVLEIEKDD